MLTLCLVIGFGGWFGPFMMGYTRDYTGDHVIGLAFMCTSLAFAIALLSIFHVTQRSTQVCLYRLRLLLLLLLLL